MIDDTDTHATPSGLDNNARFIGYTPSKQSANEAAAVAARLMPEYDEPLVVVKTAVGYSTQTHTLYGHNGKCLYTIMHVALESRERERDRICYAKRLQAHQAHIRYDIILYII